MEREKDFVYLNAFVWDTAKNEANKKKHKGLSFELASRIFNDPLLYQDYDYSHSDLEDRAIDFPPLTDDDRAALEKLDKIPDSEIDFSDIPPSKENGNGGFYYIQALKMPKTDIHTKIDNDNLAWLKQAGKGYQQRLNNVLSWARMNNCPISSL